MQPHFAFKISGEPIPIGMDLPSAAAAKGEAPRYASKAVCDDPQQFWDAREFRMTVTDGKGLTLSRSPEASSAEPGVQLRKSPP